METIGGKKFSSSWSIINVDELLCNNSEAPTFGVGKIVLIATLYRFDSL